MILLHGDLQNNKLLILGKLAASLAHEVRNPLSVLKLNLDYLALCKDELNNELIESIDACRSAAERIQVLMENTLDFSRRSNKDVEEYSIQDLFRHSTVLLDGELKKKNLSLLFSYPEPIPKIFVDKNKILQVFVNLINNAIEASNNNNKIEIAVVKAKTNIVIEIKDYGVGIKEEDKIKIFKDFYTNKPTGTGLGLSVCKMLLAEIGADLNFESKEGEGSKFFITFPQKNIGEY